MTTSEVMTTKFTDSSEGKFWKYFAKGDETRFFDERNLAGNINIDAPCSYNLQWKNGIRDDCGSNRVSCDGSDIRAIESYPGTFVWRFAKKKRLPLQVIYTMISGLQIFSEILFCCQGLLPFVIEFIDGKFVLTIVKFGYLVFERAREGRGVKPLWKEPAVLMMSWIIEKKIIISSPPCNVLFMLRLKSIWIIYCHLEGIKKNLNQRSEETNHFAIVTNVNFNKP